MEEFIRTTDLFTSGLIPRSSGRTNRTIPRSLLRGNLLKYKPDFKVFSYGDGDGSRFLVTIPEGLEVSAPFVKASFSGGLWAVVTVTRENNDGWTIIDELYGDRQNINNKGSYKNDQLSGRPRHEVYFNPLNISNLKNTDLFNTVFNPEYLDIYIPVKE